MVIEQDTKYRRNRLPFLPTVILESPVNQSPCMSLVPGENPGRTCKLHKNPRLDLNPGPSCCEVTVLTSATLFKDTRLLLKCKSLFSMPTNSVYVKRFIINKSFYLFKKIWLSPNKLSKEATNKTAELRQLSAKNIRTWIIKINLTSASLLLFIL